MQTCENCPTQTPFFNPNNSLCESCDTNCKTCINLPTNCTSCYPGNVIDGKTFKCVFDEFPLTNKCHPNCKTCWRTEDEYYCETCADNRKIIKSSKIYVKTCECPAGTTDKLDPLCLKTDQQDTLNFTTLILFLIASISVILSGLIAESPYIILGFLQSAQFLSYLRFIKMMPAYGADKIFQYLFYTNFNYAIPFISSFHDSRENEI